jgi:hypothetical protein
MRRWRGPGKQQLASLIVPSVNQPPPPSQAYLPNGGHPNLLSGIISAPNQCTAQQQKQHHANKYTWRREQQPAGVSPGLKPPPPPRPPLPRPAAAAAGAGRGSFDAADGLQPGTPTAVTRAGSGAGDVPGAAAAAAEGGAGRRARAAGARARAPTQPRGERVCVARAAVMVCGVPGGRRRGRAHHQDNHAARVP